jgi:hypothetical protein
MVQPLQPTLTSSSQVKATSNSEQSACLVSSSFLRSLETSTCTCSPRAEEKDPPPRSRDSRTRSVCNTAAVIAISQHPAQYQERHHLHGEPNHGKPPRIAQHRAWQTAPCRQRTPNRQTHTLKRTWSTPEQPCSEVPGTMRRPGRNPEEINSHI